MPKTQDRIAMALKGIAKVQHYVPQFLLKKFCNDKKDQVFVFDKQSAQTFSCNVKNIASESRFYDLRIDDKEVTLERQLSELEGATKPLLDRIIEKDSVQVFDASELDLLCSFLAVQFTRTKAFREQTLNGLSMMREEIIKKFGSAKFSIDLEEELSPLNTNDQKILMAQTIMSAPADYGPHFANKVWILMATTENRPFYLGDNPLALQNMTSSPLRSGLGLAVPGIEIYLPLSPLRALVLMCPSHISTMLDGRERIQKILHSKHQLAAPQIDELTKTEKFITSIESHRYVEVDANNVINFNSLQVSYAERFVFSRTADFALPKEMVAAHPTLRKGRRMRVM
ncbi:MAG TPA: DUF4238 domain-containing protein [Burkholderiaceae bacterium]